MIKKTASFYFLLALFSCSNTGHYVPPFNLVTLEGKNISEADLRGKITIINVWATWCPNCLNELGELNKLASLYKDDTTVVFLAVSDEPPETIKAFLNRKAFNFIHIPNGKKVTDGLQTRMVKTYPQLVVLRKDLKIAFENSGELDNASEILNKEIKSLR
jgi:peroxiredoxin